MKKKQIVHILLLIALALLVGCGQQAPTIEETVAPAETIPPCTTTECFVSLANECAEGEVTIVEDAGVFTYAAKDCVFTKTFVSLDPSETEEMKNLLEGKSFRCTYQQGQFDDRWVTSLIFGIEYCEGTLKDALVGLLVFV